MGPAREGPEGGGGDQKMRAARLKEITAAQREGAEENVANLGEIVW